MEKTKWFLDILDNEGKILKSVIIDELLSKEEMEKKARYILRCRPWVNFRNLDYSIIRYT